MTQSIRNSIAAIRTRPALVAVAPPMEPELGILRTTLLMYRLQARRVRALG
jgi:hypothetical protein